MQNVLIASAAFVALAGPAHAAELSINSPESQAYACAILDFVEAATGQRQAGVENCTNIPQSMRAQVRDRGKMLRVGESK
jgi:hypothetical protein